MTVRIAVTWRGDQDCIDTGLGRAGSGCSWETDGLVLWMLREGSSAREPDLPHVFKRAFCLPARDPRLEKGKTGGLRRNHTTEHTEPRCQGRIDSPLVDKGISRVGSFDIPASGRQRPPRKDHLASIGHRRWLL